MKKSFTLVTIVVGTSLAACGGGGSDSAVSANPPAPTPVPAPTPSAPVPAPSPIGNPPAGKLPAPLTELPAGNGATFSGAQIARALAQPVSPVSDFVAGRRMYLGLGTALAGYVESNGTTITTRTLAPAGSQYEQSRSVSITPAQVSGGLAPSVDGVRYDGTPLPLTGNFAANQQAAEWTSGANKVALWPTVIANKPGALRLCWLIQTSAAFRFACTDHREADGRIFGAATDEVIEGTVYPLRWQWEATPRAGGWALADYAPGGDAAIPARAMNCTTTTIGPGSTGPVQDIRQVTLTPSEVLIGNELFERHEISENTESRSGNQVTYTHSFAPNPATLFQTSYTLEAGRLTLVRRAQGGATSGSRIECQ
ncbi:MAG: hypothetical protein AB7G13_30885 [Lautropia sp.]